MSAADTVRLQTLTCCIQMLSEKVYMTQYFHTCGFNFGLSRVRPSRIGERRFISVITRMTVTVFAKYRKRRGAIPQRQTSVGTVGRKKTRPGAHTVFNNTVN